MTTSLNWYFAAFFAPTLFVGFALAALPPRHPSWRRWLLQGSANALCGALALLLLLALSRQEGAVAGYVALCLASALSQWQGARVIAKLKWL